MFATASQSPNTASVPCPADELKPLALLRDELKFGIRRYIRSQTPVVARRVASALEGLICHPDFHADLAERCICKRMLVQWRMLAEVPPGCVAPGTKPPLGGQWTAGAIASTTRAAERGGRAPQGIRQGC